MRILTLGVLIVSGGTLAALPFRRYRAIPDARVAPAQATGPSQSALDSHKLESIAAAPPTTPEPVLSIADHLPKYLPPTETDRRISMPLTYEDLAIPVDQPDAIKSRFNATVSVQQEANEHNEQLALVMPTMESISILQPASSQSLVTVQAASEQTTLASTVTREQASVVLPSGSASPRERHWIRQPAAK